MKCNHISEHVPGTRPFSDGKFFIGDLRCRYCKVPFWKLMGMTKKQLEMDREVTYKNHETEN